MAAFENLHLCLTQERLSSRRSNPFQLTHMRSCGQRLRRDVKCIEQSQVHYKRKIRSLHERSRFLIRHWPIRVQCTGRRRCTIWITIAKCHAPAKRYLNLYNLLFVAIIFVWINSDDDVRKSASFKFINLSRSKSLEQLVRLSREISVGRPKVQKKPYHDFT